MSNLKSRVLFVGAFPSANAQVYGGNITDCKALLDSSFADSWELILLDTTQRSVPPPSLFKRTVLALWRSLKFVMLVESRRPDAVLIFASSGMSFVEKSLHAAYARFRGAGVALSVRSGHFMDKCRRERAFRTMAAVLLRAPHYVMCQGRAWQEFFASVFQMPEAKCPIVNSWVANQPLLNIGERRIVKCAGVVELLFVGWVERFKGIMELLDAVQRLSASSDTLDLRLTIAGGGGALADAIELVQRRGLGDRVTFKGWVAADEMQVLLEKADVFVLPSHTEGLPNAMVEAMAAGLPVVVTPVGSIPDVVVNGQQGILVPVEGVDALVDALRTLALDHAARERMGREARRTAAALFGVEPGARNLTALLKRACARAN